MSPRTSTRSTKSVLGSARVSRATPVRLGLSAWRRKELFVGFRRRQEMKFKEKFAIARTRSPAR
ncbi:MAG: hypothetical protein ACREIW_15200, partial [Chthoniobacterales bacterium]